MVAITLTQDSYRLWARIGNVYGNGTLYPNNVLVQLAQLDATSIIHELP
jgi:hypothetical protein